MLNLEILKEIEKDYDLIFIDITKRPKDIWFEDAKDYVDKKVLQALSIMDFRVLKSVDVNGKEVFFLQDI